MVPSTGKPGEGQMDPWMKAQIFFRTQARSAELPQQPRVELDGSRTVRDGLTSMADGAPGYRQMDPWRMTRVLFRAQAGRAEQTQQLNKSAYS